MSTEFDYEHLALHFILVFFTTLAIAIFGQTQCSFLGISQGLYSIFRFYDCTLFLLRDWVCFFSWINITYYAIIAICIAPNFTTRKNILQIWFIGTVGVILLELMIPISLCWCGLDMVYSWLGHIFHTDSTALRTENKTVAQVQITPGDTRLSELTC